MAAGFRSYAFRWFTGYAAGGGGPVEPGCPCPDWTVEKTLVNAFIKEQTLTNTFKKDQTLTNQWQRKACD